MADDANGLRPPILLCDDMAWCWWTRPRATRVGSKVYLGAIDSAGGIVAATFDIETRAVERRRLAQFEDDDHNNPALLAAAGRPLVCFYSRHDAEEGLRYRISRGPLDLSEWEPERILSFRGSTTYAQVHRVAEELHLFVRVDETRWGWRLSTDWARSWEPPRDLLDFDTDQQVYMATALLEDGKTLRVAVSGHPKEYEAKPLHDVWACLVDLETGAVTTPTDGRTVGNLRTGQGLPLNFSELEVVQRTSSERTVNLFDVSSGPAFEVAYVSKLKDDLSTRDARYHVASLHDGSWQLEEIVPAGRKFGYIDAGLYVGGMAFPEHSRDGRVFLSRESEGLWHLELWRRQAGGQWVGQDLVPPRATRLVRPWPVSPPAAAVGVVALALERYAEDSYYGSLSHLVGAPVPPEGTP